MHDGTKERSMVGGVGEWDFWICMFDPLEDHTLVSPNCVAYLVLTIDNLKKNII